VHYADAFAVGYKAELVTATGSLTAATREQLTMLRLSRANPERTNMRTFYKNCLVSINGFYHITDTDGNYAYVLDAGKSSVKSRQNQVGILNFMDIGELEIIPITEDMIFNQGDGSTLQQRAYVKLPNQYSTEGKVPILVMGGYLNFVGNSFWQSGDNTFSLDFHAMRLLSRFYESLPYIDFDYLGLSGTTHNIDQVSLQQFFSDEVLTKYMTSTQSFVVLVNTSQLFTNKIRLRGAKLPGMFVSESTPRYPLIMGYGRVGEYWKTYEDQQWWTTCSTTASLTTRTRTA
jgi:hypothetical protein